jgi:nucleoside-diphosphate-sugar epimerase
LKLMKKSRGRILVTGGAGYIGSVLIPMLLRAEYSVRAIDILPWGFQSLQPALYDPKLESLKGDIRDKHTLKEALGQVDGVVNLAAIVGFPACKDDPFAARTTNSDAVHTLTSLLSSDQKLVQASTISIYGQVSGVCDEETKIRPTSLYAETKALADNLVLEHGGISLRFATAFGASPRLRLDLLVNHIVYEAVRHKRFSLFQGAAQRSFIHSTDVARGIVFALEHYDLMKGRSFNVGDESLNCTKLEVAEKVRKLYDFRMVELANGTDEDMRDYIVCFDRIKRLGFAVKTDIESGITELLKIVPLITEASPYRNA